ncbi:MAG: metallophosphoesterase family protein [Treponema sp.]|nr:metallophosphoesterase family protein [Treponema sp.]
MKMVKLWALISVVTALAFMSTACIIGPGTNPDVSGGPPYNITNNFAEDSSTGFIVQWHNDTDVPSQTLQYVEESGNWSDATEIIVTGVLWNPTKTPTDVGPYTARNIFRTEVSGLTPATKYQYRMGSPGNWSETFYHLTSNGSFTNFSFTVGADTQDNVFNQMKATFNAANTYDSDNRFFLVAGDISDYPQEDINEFPNFLKAVNELTNRLPVVTTQGNHDTYLVNTSNRDGYVFGSAEVYNSFITSPNNGWARKTGQANAGPHRSDSYYFYYNEVLIIMLNTMATQNATGPAEPNHAAQRTWLENVLKNDKDNNLSKYIIAVTHIPFFAGRGLSSTPSASEPWLMANTRAAYGKIFSDYDVDIVFFGHDHVYTRSNPIKFGTNTALAWMYDNNVFNTVTNGTIYSIAGSIGPKIYAFRNHPADPTAAPVSTNIHTYIPYHWPTRTDAQSPGMFINIKVTAENLNVTVRRLNQNDNMDSYVVPAKQRGN